jgi:pyruvate dehydrogenase E2 component (dihydrolipoamide acetyltransferase)
MISEVVMPQMGADMTEGTLVRWLKHEGDAVERGEIIAEIETDKANVEIEAFESGVFRKVLAQEGDTVDVGTLIAIIASADEDVSKYESAGVTAAQRPAPAAKVAEAAPAIESAGPAAETAKPVTPVRTNGRVRASPVARRLAEEHGVDLAQLRGSGPDGRIVRQDVEAAIASSAAPPRREEAAPAAAGMSKMRQTIARRMSQSKREAPHYYITVDIDMTDAERMRHQINDSRRRELHLSANDFLVKAAALALEKHPHFNTWIVDGEVRPQAQINVCIAVTLAEGLIAPAILDCGSKTLLEISAAGQSLVERAKSGAFKPEEVSSGTFTISSLSMYRIETLIAIIQPPQTAILGAGGVREEAVVRDGRIEVGKLMKVALSGDHRVTDGAQGAKFLNEIRRFLENPASLLL